MGIVSKEDIALALLEQADSRDKAFGTKSIVFAHKFTGGETSVDLLSLTTPPELLANGFVNASPSEIAAAHLSVFKKNVKLSLSRGPSGLELKQWAHFVVSGNQINFIGGLQASGGAQAGEILFGEIVTVPSNSIVVGDMRWIRGTIPISVGQQLVPIPYPYKVGVNLSQGQAGDIKIKKQGVMLYRNVGNATASPSADGNFQEIDAGNGYGTSIMLNVPATTAFLLEYEVGFQLSSGDLSLWSALESFEGALLALAGDAAYNFYGDSDLTRYISSAPSALERRAFGDLITASIERVAALENNLAELQLEVTSTAAQTGVNGVDLEYTGMTLPLTPGNWLISGYAMVTTTDVSDIIQLGLRDITNGIDLPSKGAPVEVGTVNRMLPLTTQASLKVINAVNIRIKLYRNGSSTPKVGNAGTPNVINSIRAVRLK